MMSAAIMENILRHGSPELLRSVGREEAESVVEEFRRLAPETGEVVAMTVKGDTVRQYREAFEKRCRTVAAACARYNTSYLRISTAEPLEQLVIDRLRRENVVR